MIKLFVRTFGAVALCLALTTPCVAATQAQKDEAFIAKFDTLAKYSDFNNLSLAIKNLLESHDFSPTIKDWLLKKAQETGNSFVTYSYITCVLATTQMPSDEDLETIASLAISLDLRAGRDAYALFMLKENDNFAYAQAMRILIRTNLGKKLAPYLTRLNRDFSFSTQLNALQSQKPTDSNNVTLRFTNPAWILSVVDTPSYTLGVKWGTTGEPCFNTVNKDIVNKYKEKTQEILTLQTPFTAAFITAHTPINKWEEFFYGVRDEQVLPELCPMTMACFKTDK